LADLQEDDPGQGGPYHGHADALFQIQSGRLVENAQVCPRCHYRVPEVDLLQSERAAIGFQLHDFEEIHFRNKESKDEQGKKDGQGNGIQ
jgi:hypothetical protein